MHHVSLVLLISIARCMLLAKQPAALMSFTVSVLSMNYHASSDSEQGAASVIHTACARADR